MDTKHNANPTGEQIILFVSLNSPSGVSRAEWVVGKMTFSLSSGYCECDRVIKKR